MLTALQRGRIDGLRRAGHEVHVLDLCRLHCTILDINPDDMDVIRRLTFNPTGKTIGEFIYVKVPGPAGGVARYADWTEKAQGALPNAPH